MEPIDGCHDVKFLNLSKDVIARGRVVVIGPFKNGPKKPILLLINGDGAHETIIGFAALTIFLKAFFNSLLADLSLSQISQILNSTNLFIRFSLKTIPKSFSMIAP